MRSRPTHPASDPAGHVATLGRLSDLQRAIAGRGQPLQAASPVPSRHGVGRVLARPLPRSQGRGVLLDAGTMLAARHVPLMAREGVGLIQVHDRMRVGILALEDRAFASAPRPRHATPAVVAALLRSAAEQLGAKAVDETCAADCGRAIAHALEGLRAQCDLVLVIGFIPPAQSAGVAATLEAHGLEWTSQDLRARPLGALQLAHCGAMPVVGLSPDLTTAFASFVAFVSPLIRRIQGRSQWLPDVEFGQLEGPMPHRNAWGFFCVSEATDLALASSRLRHCKRRDGASTIAEASGLAWRPLDLGLHRDANVAYYPFHRWLQ